MTQPERLDLPALPDVPESVTTLPDNLPEHEQTQTDFFLGIADALGYTSQEARRLCEIRPRSILRSTDDGETNDLLIELLVRDQTAASVLQIRTEFNYTQIMYACYVTDKNFHRLRYVSY